MAILIVLTIFFKFNALVTANVNYYVFFFFFFRKKVNNGDG